MSRRMTNREILYLMLLLLLVGLPAGLLMFPLAMWLAPYIAKFSAWLLPL